MTVKFKVFCPKGVRTGGPEALHQLADALVKLGKDAQIVYFGDLAGSDVFPEYDVPKVSSFDPGKSDLFVVSEVDTDLLAKGKYWRSAIYWLSVDNHFRKKPRLIEAYSPSRLRKYVASKIKGGYRLSKGFTVDYHLYQSEYAKLFLLRNLRKEDGKIYEITDYLPLEYRQHAEEPITADRRRDWVAYNPAKLGKVGEAVLACMPSQSLKPIANLDKAGVVELLSQCKVYIDFGPHPGMDRIPREAAACGCLILVGERGSASYYKDVPVPARYKIYLRNPSIQGIVAEINEMIMNYDELLSTISVCRNSIARGYDSYLKQVEEWLAGERF